MLTVGGVATGVLAGVPGDRLSKGTRIPNRIAAPVFGGPVARLAVT